MYSHEPRLPPPYTVPKSNWKLLSSKSVVWGTSEFDFLRHSNEIFHTQSNVHYYIVAVYIRSNFVTHSNDNSGVCVRGKEEIVNYFRFSLLFVCGACAVFMKGSTSRIYLSHDEGELNSTCNSICDAVVIDVICSARFIMGLWKKKNQSICWGLWWCELYLSVSWLIYNWFGSFWKIHSQQLKIHVPHTCTSYVLEAQC